MKDEAIATVRGSYKHLSKRYEVLATACKNLAVFCVSGNLLLPFSQMNSTSFSVGMSTISSVERNSVRTADAVAPNSLENGYSSVSSIVNSLNLRNMSDSI